MFARKTAFFTLMMTLSLGVFAASITIIAPNGGEKWQKGSDQTIKWTSSQIASGNVKLTLWRGGINLGTVAYNIPVGQGAYKWKVGALQSVAAQGPGAGYTIKIRLQGATPSDFSDAPFDITSSAPAPSGSIQVTSPNGGENWSRGSSSNITWTAPGINSGTFRIKLLKGGAPVGIIASGIPATQHFYSWNVGATNLPFPGAGANYRVQVELQGGSALDFSDKPFSIADPSPPKNASIRVTAPAAGFSVKQGSSFPVRWTAANVSGTVEIALLELSKGLSHKVSSGIAAGLGTYTVALGTPGVVCPPGDYQAIVTQGAVTGKSAVFKILLASDLQMIPPRPGNPVYQIQNKGKNQLVVRPGLFLISGPKILKFNLVNSNVTYPGTITLEYQTQGADKVELIRYDIHNLPESPAAWTSSSPSGRIVFATSFDTKHSELLYRLGELTRDFNLIARKGSKFDEKRVSVKIKPKYPDVVVNQAQIEPVQGPWGAEASFRFDYSNALRAELSPLHADPADPHGKQNLQISGNNGARVYGVEKIKRHAGAQWRLRLLRRDKGSWVEKELYTATNPPKVKQFSVSPAKINGPGVVTFKVGFEGAMTADLVDVVANRVLHTFPGQIGGAVNTTHTVQVSVSSTFQLRLKRFSTVVRSPLLDVTVESRPMGGYNFNVKREGGIFPGPNAILEYEVYGQDFLKFYYQEKGQPDPRTLIKEFTGLNGTQLKGSFKHRPSGFPARYKVIIRDTNGSLQIFYYSAN